MTQRKALALVSALLFAVSLSFASSAAALPRCPDICTITCPCETPCILFGTIVATCAEFACDPGLSLTFLTAEEFPILEFTEGASVEATIDLSESAVQTESEEAAEE